MKVDMPLRKDTKPIKRCYKKYLLFFWFFLTKFFTHISVTQQKQHSIVIFLAESVVPSPTPWSSSY